MRWNLVLASLLTAFSAAVSAEEMFSPHLTEPSADPVCGFALKHYVDQFDGGATETTGVTKSREIEVPLFATQEIEGQRGRYKTASISIEGEEKVIAYHERSHSWRGEIYTGYMFSPDESRSLEENLESADMFYPMGSLIYGSDFSWWENFPFKFQGKWYVLADFKDFTRHDAVRNVYQLHRDGTSTQVCSVKIFDNFDSKEDFAKHPVFAAYQKAVESIMLSPGSCGSSRPEAHAQTSGQLFASTAIVRPWAITPTWYKGNYSGAGGIEGQKKHFDDWKYQDIWSFREHQTYENLKFDAIRELKQHYVQNFHYSDQSAEELASGVIAALPGRYYSLGYYPDYDKDFSFFDRLMEGHYPDFSRLEEDLKLKRNSIPLVALSLMIDNPAQYANLPPQFDGKVIKSKYGKDLLMYAAHMNNYDATKYLLEAGWPIDAVTSYKPAYNCGPAMERLNRSALTYAAENASIELIQLLVDAGFDTTIEDSKGNGLDYYIARNPRFSDEEIALGFDGLMQSHSKKAPVQPSFSCTANLNRLERAICDSRTLSIYDRELSKAYAGVIGIDGMAGDLKASQISWIKRRAKDCGAAPDNTSLSACLARSYRSRTRYLQYIQAAFSDKG
ncbi:ankyrin repeat domain-containing protein [Microbulbifer sp. MCCC 1A16149]|uniref:ankyrin repeat domain-containing protein n=1 Tax=Microbulbifer sp. MCCC 1A16149 TaxID=3411322 RepID=UPI003D10333F